MGESFLGLPNRFKVIGEWDKYNESKDISKELSKYKTYDSTKVLSTYFGYELSTQYLSRCGGEDFCMRGDFYTGHLYPNNDTSWDIGKPNRKYNRVYASVFEGSLSGNANTASKLSEKKTIELTGSVIGSIETDLSGKVTINTSTNHNHDGRYLKLTNGGPQALLDELHTKSIIPNANSMYNIGSENVRYSSIYADKIYAETKFSGDLSGNADSASKLKNSRTITVRLSPSSSGTEYDYGSRAFDGTGDIEVNVKASYLPITGGTMTGDITTRNILPAEGASWSSAGLSGYSIGSSSYKYKELYAESLYGTTFSGTSANAIKLASSRKIEVNIERTEDPLISSNGYVDFNGSENVSMSVLVPYLSCEGGNLYGDIVPKTNEQLYLGKADSKFRGVYATDFYGNASSAGKLTTARNITVGKSTKSFDGSGNLSFSLAEIGAADASVVGATTDFKSSEYVYISENDNLGSDGTIALTGDSSVSYTLEAGTYIIIARIAANLLARSISIGLSIGGTPSDHTYTTIPSCPIVSDSNGDVKARTKAFMHRVQSTSVQKFSGETTVSPYIEIAVSPQWGDKNFSYKLAIQAIRIK